MRSPARGVDARPSPEPASSFGRAPRRAEAPPAPPPVRRGADGPTFPSRRLRIHRAVNEETPVADRPLARLAGAGLLPGAPVEAVLPGTWAGVRRWRDLPASAQERLAREAEVSGDAAAAREHRRAAAAGRWARGEDEGPAAQATGTAATATGTTGAGPSSDGDGAPLAALLARVDPSAPLADAVRDIEDALASRAARLARLDADAAAATDAARAAEAARAALAAEPARRLRRDAPCAVCGAPLDEGDLPSGSGSPLPAAFRCGHAAHLRCCPAEEGDDGRGGGGCPACGEGAAALAVALAAGGGGGG